MVPGKISGGREIKEVQCTAVALSPAPGRIKKLSGQGMDNRTAYLF